MGEASGFRKLLKTERFSILLGAIAGLAACAELDVGAQALKASVAAGDSNVEGLAPVQLATDAEGYALWPGFSSSNGAWIAHPRLPAPARAHVRNTLNGRVIEAKLLRRDPTTPGPMILLSAEAARDLDIGPHRLTKVQIEVIEDSLPDASVAAAPAEEFPEPAPTAAVASAELAPVADAEPLAAIVEAPAPVADAPGGEAAAPTPQVLAEVPAGPASSVASAAPTAPAQPEPAQPVPAPGGAGVFRGDAPYELGGGAGGGELPIATPASTPAATPAPAAAAPAEPVREPVASRSVAPAPDAAPAPAPVATLTDRVSFVQVVSFSAESSAAELATRLSALGHPTVTDSGVSGETRWHRVLIGPLSSAEEEGRALEAARSLGYSDAYVTVRPAAAMNAPASVAPAAGAQAPAASASATPVPLPTPAAPMMSATARTPQPAAAPSPAEPIKTTPKPAPAPTQQAKSTAPAAAPAAPAAAPSTASSGGVSPYIQVGSFSVQSNADALVAQLKGKGLPSFAAPGRPDQSKLSRVLIGPLDGPEETARALEVARSLGHKDAFVTRF